MRERARRSFKSGSYWDLKAKLEKEELQKAIFHTEKAIELDNKLENCYLNLATIYNQKGDYKKSLSLTKKELLLNENSELSYQLICELIKKGEYLTTWEKSR